MGFFQSIRHVVAIGLYVTIVSAAPADAVSRHLRTSHSVLPTIYVGQRKIRVPPIVEHGRVLVPVRGVFEAIGADVSYSPPHFVVVRKDGAVIAAFIIGRSLAVAGRRTVELEAPPMRRAGRIYVPLRVVAEAAGATVAYTSRPPIVHIRQRVDVLAVVPPVDTPLERTNTLAEAALRASSSSWTMGVAIVTSLCCLGCLALTARRFAPTLFRSAPPKRALPPVQRDGLPSDVPPADAVALSSVQTSGEARFHKQLVTETRTIQVPVTREELVIEYAGEGGTVIIEGRTLEAGETVRIPLWEERVHVDVTKHIIRKEDVVIDKRRITATAAANERPPEPDVAEGNPS